MAGLAAIHDVGFRDVDLDDMRVPVFGLVFKPAICEGAEIDHVVVDIGRALVLASVTGLSTSPSSRLKLVFSALTSLKASSSCWKLYCFLLPSGNSTVASLLLYSSNLALLAFVSGGAGFGFEVVGDGVDVGAPVGENRAHCQQPAIDVVKLLR